MSVGQKVLPATKLAGMEARNRMRKKVKIINFLPYAFIINKLD